MGRERETMISGGGISVGADKHAGFQIINRTVVGEVVLVLTSAFWLSSQTVLPLDTKLL